MSIGEVMALLRTDFADVSISKIRFLEDQGLVHPGRTPAGYRKFSREDVDRLRFVLARQRDHYEPLKVIRDHLEAVDRGLVPAERALDPRRPRLVDSSGGALEEEPGQAGEPDVAEPAAGPTQGGGALDLLAGAAHGLREHTAGRDVRLSRAELAELAEVDTNFLDTLESYGLISAQAGTGRFDGHAVVVARSAGRLAAFGIEPRHLRSFRAAADREAGLVEQVVSPHTRHHDPQAVARVQELTREVAALCLQLHGGLVSGALSRSGS